MRTGQKVKLMDGTTGTVGPYGNFVNVNNPYDSGSRTIWQAIFGCWKGVPVEDKNSLHKNNSEFRGYQDE